MNEAHMTEESITDILNDSGPTEEVTEAAVETTEAAPEQSTDRPRDEFGRFAPKGEKEEGAPPVPQEAEPANIPYAALKDERSKRQAAEDRARQLEEHFARLQQPQAQADGPPDRWEDPEGYDQWLIGQASQAARNEAAQTYQLERVRTAAVQMRQQLPDYEQNIQVFGQMAQLNPALMEEMHRAPNPAEYAYNIGKMQTAISQHGGIQGYIDAQVKAAQNPEPQQQLPSGLPPTLSSERSLGNRSGPAWSGPASISDILKG